MAKSNFGQILLLDNDVMVYMFKLQFAVDRIAIDRALTYLALQYSRIWIPRTVKKEFLLWADNKQRAKRLDKILSNYPFITECPVHISKTEIVSLIGNSEDNIGEADAILQALKAKTIQNIFFRDICILSNDKGAHKTAASPPKKGGKDE
jgi:hypothetical protein